MEALASQSVLHPAAGSAAELLAQLGNVLYVGAAAIFTFVMVLAVFAAFSKPRAINTRLWILGGGLAFPIVTVTMLLIYSIAVGNGLAAIGSKNALQLILECFGVGEGGGAPRDDLLRVQVVGKQWWWEVRYPQDGAAPIVTANELRIPTDRPVELTLSTTDVIHSFWVPSIAGKVDMIPGRTTNLRLQVSEAGRFRGLCAEYCGGQHALMAFHVVSMAPEEFERWRVQQQRSVSQPGDPLMKRGYDAFFASGCAECHAIRGTPAVSTRGPDLTHVGSRPSLAAGVLNNHVGTMAGWIAGAQDVKPGSFMPSTPVASGEDLRALAAWLGSLE
jgi:cytochrome c oxidase subunit 2